jgi:ElaB/YqjD/DUF883 family membrane-anchored ribosome-binding protein
MLNKRKLMKARLDTPTLEPHNTRAGNLIGDFKTFIHRAEEKTVERAKAADRVVRGYPYQAIACVLGVGVLIGVLAGRKWRS